MLTSRFLVEKYFASEAVMLGTHWTTKLVTNLVFLEAQDVQNFTDEAWSRGRLIKESKLAVRSWAPRQVFLSADGGVKREIGVFGVISLIKKLFKIEVADFRLADDVRADERQFRFIYA